MPVVTGLFHGGITVADMDRALTFYRDGLGLEVRFDRVLDAPYLHEVLAVPFSTIRVVYLYLPGQSDAFLELLEYRDAQPGRPPARPSDPGSGHLCLYVDDVAGLHSRLSGAGFRARSERTVDITAGPNAGARSVYMLDPDGYPVELFQRPAPAG